MAGSDDIALEIPQPAAADEDSCAPPTDFDAFFGSHRQQLLHFLRRRTGRDEDAQDLLQETWLRMRRYGYAEPRPEPVWRSLLYRTAASLASNLGREHRLRHADAHQPVEQVELPSAEPSPERQVHARQEFERMLEVLRDLPPRCRQVFVLHRLHGRSYGEIARHCGISVKAVEKQIGKALAAFRSRVGDSPWEVSE